MKQQPLLPYRFKKIGWLLFIPFAIAGIYLHITDYEPKFLPFITKVCFQTGNGFPLLKRISPAH
jgi:hypothetical protein